MRLLKQIYAQLDFREGELFKASATPIGKSRKVWIDKGEWLAASSKAGVEHVFFVDNNPVAVFATCKNTQLDKIRTFNRIWCIARPRLLFLQSGGDVTIYDLAQNPIDESDDSTWDRLTPLEVLDSASDIQSQLADFHRTEIESGRLFEDTRFGDVKNRADNALIRDLKTVRHELAKSGLNDEKLHFAHALIGRSIFIRYLEDRGVLTPKYYFNLARQKAGWTDLLRQDSIGCGLDISANKSLFIRILSDKDFTFALFEKLSKDFNGDMFPNIKQEKKHIAKKHLQILQNLLSGQAGNQYNLFFYAYKFDVIPLELISSIYEEFYHGSQRIDFKKSKADEDGAFYTPSVLVEFVLESLLDEKTLEKSPRIIDPACGSGIFLVESFRRIVRYHWHKNRNKLTFGELKKILKHQISGIEYNLEAAKIAAFSLYLSMLHYLDPPSIQKQISLGNKLPNLIASEKKGENYYHSILPCNAFDIDRIEENKIWRNRFGANCADIVVGNPPWGGSPGKNGSQERKDNEQLMLSWCHKNDYIIGDKEPSQAFLWRAYDLLKNNCRAGMLVTSGILFKHAETSKKFRDLWLGKVTLDEVHNFAHVRKHFFKGVKSPFLMIKFTKQDQKPNKFLYANVKDSAYLSKNRAVKYSKYDYFWLPYKYINNVKTWKIFWFGSYTDLDLVRYLQNFDSMGKYVDQTRSGSGYKLGNKKYDFYNIKSLNSKSFSRYNDMSFTDSPQKTERPRNENLYKKPRILVKRGISKHNNESGHIIARYVKEDFAFSEWCYGIQFSNPEDWKYKVALGVLWSSLARYYLFMVTSQWGLWYDNIHYNDELLKLPIIFDEDNLHTHNIIGIVNKIIDKKLYDWDIFREGGMRKNDQYKLWKKLEGELDNEIFELFGLTKKWQDAVYDLCEVNLPFFYKPLVNKKAFGDRNHRKNEYHTYYARTFIRNWNAFLPKNKKMSYRVHLTKDECMVAIEFFVHNENKNYVQNEATNNYSNVLQKYSSESTQDTYSKTLDFENVIHVITQDTLLIAKPNIRRFWTRTVASEDAQSFIAKCMMNFKRTVSGDVGYAR